MKRALLLMLVAAMPALAQDPPAPQDPPARPEDEAPFSRGVEQLLRDLFSEIEPTLRELRDTIGNLNDYEAPEMLPNGDIIIRRKTPLPPSPEPEVPEAEPEEPAPEGGIDL